MAIHHTNDNPVEYKTKSFLLLYPYLDCAVHKEQKMPNLTPKDMYMRYVIDHHVGKNQQDVLQKEKMILSVVVLLAMLSLKLIVLI